MSIQWSLLNTIVIKERLFASLKNSLNNLLDHTAFAIVSYIYIFDCVV
jgi:hypothetical protein